MVISFYQYTHVKGIHLLSLILTLLRSKATELNLKYWFIFNACQEKWFQFYNRYFRYKH